MVATFATAFSTSKASVARWHGRLTLGVMAQAALAFLLSLYGVAEMFTLWWRSGALAMLVISGLVLLVSWLVDMASGP
jgi:hypothetical protein